MLHARRDDKATREVGAESQRSRHPPPPGPEGVVWPGHFVVVLLHRLLESLLRARLKLLSPKRLKMYTYLRWTVLSAERDFAQRPGKDCFSEEQQAELVIGVEFH